MQSLSEQLREQYQQLPRLQDITTEYLDDIARQLQNETFSEQAKQSYDEAWQQHYAQLETAAIMFHGDGNDLTLCCKLIDSRIRNLEYEMESLGRYGQKIADSIADHVITDPEITVLEHRRLVDLRDKLRDQYAYIKNMHYVLPEIERRTGYTMGVYKSRKSLEAEKKARQWRPVNKRVTADRWLSMSKSEQQAYLNQHCKEV